MGTINILKNGYRGKLGATVGQQWNGQLTLRTYLEHNNSKTEAQLKQRAAFKEKLHVAQTAYPYVQNLIPPKGYKGTKWNFVASTIGQIDLNAGFPADGLAIGNYNKKNLMLKAFPMYNGGIYAYVYLSATNGSLNPNDYNPAIIPIFDPTRPVPANYQLVSVGTIINKSITVNLFGAPAQKGFLMELIGVNFQVAPVLFALQGRAIKHDYKSVFQPAIPAINITDAMLQDN